MPRVTRPAFTLVFDLDDTAAQYREAFQSRLRRWGHHAGWAPPAADYDFTAAGWFTTRDEYLTHHRRAVREGMFADMDPMPGFLDAAHELADDGVRLAIATHRHLTGDPAWARLTTLAWLTLIGAPVDKVYFRSAKHTVPGDLYVDDAPHVIADLDAHGRDRLVFDRPFNRHIAGGRVASWEDVVDQVRVRREAAAA